MTGDTVEEALADFWDAEPPPAWFRDTVNQPFSVGDRVRVRHNPECFYCRSAGDEDGLEGVVSDIHGPTKTGDLEPGEAEHVIWVDFPDVIPSHGCSTSHFAPVELEPTDD